MRIPSGKYTRGGWYCKCDCGRYRVTRTDGLGNNGNKRVISCGCFNDEQWDKMHKNQWKEINELSDGNKRHPYHLLMGRFRHMHDRCENPNDSHYSNYGGRGIKVCDEWSDYEVYKKWMLKNGYDPNRPAIEQTIDRIDVNGNYEPDNCRLVNTKVQANNKRTNVYVKYHNKTKTLSEWGNELGIDFHTLRARYYDLKWRGDKLFQPTMNRGGATEHIKYYSRDYTFKQLSEETMIAKSTLRQRYNKGLRDGDLVKIPTRHKNKGDSE